MTGESTFIDSIKTLVLFLKTTLVNSIWVILDILAGAISIFLIIVDISTHQYASWQL